MMYTIAFIVTFVIGGMTGVLLALPPADYLMHNSTFLVAHFHNMLIPGALFGYFAALNLWFPKAFGFKLDERWGKRSFWCWVIGFYLAFMPLYLLGFMGMPRRMEHYDTAAWQPWLIVAFVGAVLHPLRARLPGRADRRQLPRPGGAARLDRRSVARPDAGMADLVAAGALQFRGAPRGRGARRLPRR